MFRNGGAGKESLTVCTCAILLRGGHLFRINGWVGGWRSSKRQVFQNNRGMDQLRLRMGWDEWDWRRVKGGRTDGEGKVGLESERGGGDRVEDVSVDET